LRCHEALDGIDRHDNPFGSIGPQDFPEHMFIGERDSPDDEFLRSSLCSSSNVGKRSQSPSKLHINIAGARNGVDNRKIIGRTAKGSIQVHDVEPCRPLLHKFLCHGHGVIAIDRYGIITALAESDAFATTEINCRQ
jgi:hypothetical protein